MDNLDGNETKCGERTILASSAGPDDLRLAELGPYIAKHHSDAWHMSVIARAAGDLAVTSAWLAGVALTKAKQQVRHGRWLAWLRDSVPTLSEAQASRYMRLARQFPRKQDLPKFGSLRKAFIAANIVKVDSAPIANRQSASYKPALLAKRFHVFEQFLNKYTEELEIDVTPATARFTLIEQIDRTSIALNAFRAKLSKTAA